MHYSTLADNTGKADGGSGAGGALYSLAYNGAAPTGSIHAVLMVENTIVANSTGLYDLIVDKPDMAIGPMLNVSNATTTAVGANLVMTSFAASLAPALPVFGRTPIHNSWRSPITMARPRRWHPL